MEVSWVKYRDADEYKGILDAQGYEQAEFWAWTQTLPKTGCADYEHKADYETRKRHFIGTGPAW